MGTRDCTEDAGGGRGADEVEALPGPDMYLPLGGAVRPRGTVGDGVCILYNTIQYYYNYCKLSVDSRNARSCFVKESLYREHNI